MPQSLTGRRHLRALWLGLIGPALLAAAVPALADPATNTTPGQVDQTTDQTAGQTETQTGSQTADQMGDQPYQTGDQTFTQDILNRGTAAAIPYRLGGQNRPTRQRPTAEAPPTLVFDLSAGLTYDSNPDLTNPPSGGGTQADLGFGLVYTKSTRTSTLVFSANGLVGGGDQGNNTGGVPQPSVRLTYSADTGRSKVNLDMGVDLSAVDVFDPTTLPDGTLVATDLTATTGTVTHQYAGFTFETGIDQPLGFDLAANYDGRLYSDTNATSIYDSNYRSGSAGLHWRIDSINTLSLLADASGTNYANVGSTTQKSADVSLGYTRLIRPDLTLQASLGHSNASATEFGITTEHSSGYVASLGLVQTQAGGSAGSIRLDTTRDALGPRTELSLGRNLVLANGNFAATAGVSARPGEAGQLVGSLDYSRLVLRADIVDVTLSRQIGLNSDNLDQASNYLGLNWEHKINEVSSLSLAATLAGVSGVEDNGVTSESRQSLSAIWSHDLTKDWQVSAGYEFHTFDSSDESKAISNSVFMTIHRKVVLLP